MAELIIGAVASLIQKWLVKIEDKNLKIVYSFMIVFLAVLAYDVFMDVAPEDFILRLGSAYGGSQVLYNILFNRSK